MDWRKISVFGALPVLAVTLLLRRKSAPLWTASLRSGTAALLVSLAAMPVFLQNPEWRALLFKLVMPMHLTVTGVRILAAYVLGAIWKRRQTACGTHERAGPLPIRLKEETVVRDRLLFCMRRETADVCARTGQAS